jgi:hypothetical protein
MAERDLDALLVDPRHRPAGGWSARAEAFADASWAGWRDTFALWREEQRLARAEADAELLYVALEEARRGADRRGRSG